MTVHDHAALEAEEQVLSDGVDPLEDASVDRAGDERATRIRRRRLDAITGERGEPVGGSTDGITLRHADKRMRERERSTRV
jgi:hypothetical protein